MLAFVSFRDSRGAFFLHRYAIVVLLFNALWFLLVPVPIFFFSLQKRKLLLQCINLILELQYAILSTE